MVVPEALWGAGPRARSPAAMTASSPVDPRWTYVVVGLLAAAIALILDQATKQLAAELLVPEGRRVELPGPFSLELTFNPGGAFGLPAPSWFFLVVTVVVVVVVVRNLPQVTTPVPAVAYGLLLAGALGNAADRVFRTGGPDDPRFLHGHVVDFIASGVWPTFNVADMSITIGFLLLLLWLYQDERGSGSGRTR